MQILVASGGDELYLTAHAVTVFLPGRATDIILISGVDISTGWREPQADAVPGREPHVKGGRPMPWPAGV